MTRRWNLHPLDVFCPAMVFNSTAWLNTIEYAGEAAGFRLSLPSFFSFVFGSHVCGTFRWRAQLFLFVSSCQALIWSCFCFPPVKVVFRGARSHPDDISAISCWIDVLEERGRGGGFTVNISLWLVVRCGAISSSRLAETHKKGGENSKCLILCFVLSKLNCLKSNDVCTDERDS